MNQMKRKAAVAAGLGVLLAFGSLTPGMAAAAPQALSDVSLAWSINDEVGGGAHFGECNFLSAGVAGNTKTSRVWDEADGFYKSSAGNVRIEKPTAGGGWNAPTWATKCQGASGTNVTTAVGSTSGNRVVFNGGVGTRDVQAGTAHIAWSGSFTFVFYGGFTYWSITNPILDIASDGTGQLTGTATGYGADRNDPGTWTALAPADIVLADFTDVTGLADGIVATPRYLGVTYANAEAEPQSTTGPAWGSFPASFVDYNLLTGQSSYWYSSGGAADQKKVTTTDGFRVSFARPTATISSATVGGVTGDRPTANGIATGLAPFAYQWERRSSGGQWQAVAGATGATYQLPALTPADAGGALRLRVKDGLGDAAVSPEIAVTFAKASVLSVTATSKAVKYGAKAQVAVKIAGRAGIAATGTVRLTVGSKIVASGTLNAAGAAVLTIPAKALVAGRHSATISYLGSAAYNAGAGKVTLQVTKAATKLTAKVKKTSIKAKARSVVTVAAKSAGSAATGKVRVTWKGTKGAAKGKSVTATATLKKGRANVKTAKLKKKGTYRVTVKYLGSANSSAKNAKAKTVKVT